MMTVDWISMSSIIFYYRKNEIAYPETSLI